MTVKLGSLRVDSTREEVGDWVPYAQWPGVRFKVRSLETTSFKVKRDQLMQKFQRKYGGAAPPQEEAEAWAKLICSELLSGWEGFDVPYAPDVALERLGDPEFRDLRQAILVCAARLGMADVEFMDDAAKKSGPPSATT